MKTIFEHIEHARSRPHHVRRRMAFGIAGAVAGLIAIIWLGASLASGAFALPDTNFADAAGAIDASASQNSAAPAASGLAGAAAALPAGGANASGAAHIEIVDVPAASSSEPAPSILPF